MSGIADLAAPYSAGIPPRTAAGEQKPQPDAQAVAVARQAISRAEGRVDADRCAHSPGCVAVDQKAVDEASAELARLQAQQNAATVASSVLSISV